MMPRFINKKLFGVVLCIGIAVLCLLVYKTKLWHFQRPITAQQGYPDSNRDPTRNGPDVKDVTAPRGNESVKHYRAPRRNIPDSVSLTISEEIKSTNSEVPSNGKHNLYRAALSSRQILEESFLSQEGRNERELLLFGAFLDDRESPKLQPYVRIPALMTDFYSRINHTFSCILHGRDRRGDWRFVKMPIVKSKMYPLVVLRKPVVVGTHKQISYSRHVFICSPSLSNSTEMWRSWTDLQAAILLDSPVGDYCLSTLSVPVEKPHTVNKSDQIEFGVCHAIAYGHVDPYRLVEWLEMPRLTGVGKVVFYNSSLQPVESKVLQHYQSDGLVEVYQFPPLALPETKQEKRLRQVMALNHCLYRNMYRFKYIIPIDTDEFIMPRTTKTLSSLINQINVKMEVTGSSVHRYDFLTVNFFQDEILNPRPDLTKPRYSHFLRYRRRYRPEPWKIHRKAIYLTNSCSVLFMHYCIGKVPDTASKNIRVDSELGLLFHYRDTMCWNVPFNVPIIDEKKCIEVNAKKGNITQDDSILRLEEDLLRSIEYTLRRLDMALQ